MLVPLSHFLKSTKWQIPRKSYNTWVLAIKNASSPHKALQLYTHMHRQSIPFDTFSILFTLKSCTHFKNLTIIHHLHSHIIKLGFNTHVYVSTCLLHAYAVMSFDQACDLFDEMPQKNIVTWNTMITGYSRSGSINKARSLFEAMPVRDAASWSAMITCYINNGFRDKGLSFFREMMANENPKPDQVTLGSVLSGCAHMGSLGLLAGKSVHGFAVKNGWELNVDIGTLLVDMYAKCGFFKNAVWVFVLMQERNVSTWTALICGAAQHGFCQEVLSLFKMMQEAGVRPNEMTFTGILNACARTGLIEEGRKYFKMIKETGLEPRIQHYGCMVDMFGKAGLLEEAYEVIKEMEFEPNIVIWGSFLSACKMHKQFDIAVRVIGQVLRDIKPENDGGIYSLVSDLYVLNKKWDDAERVRNLVLNQNLIKARGSSCI